MVVLRIRRIDTRQSGHRAIVAQNIMHFRLHDVQYKYTYK